MGSSSGNCLPWHWQHSAPHLMRSAQKEKLLPPPLRFCSQRGWLKVAEQAKLAASCAEMVAAAWSQLHGPDHMAAPGAGRPGSWHSPPLEKRRKKMCMCFFLKYFITEVIPSSVIRPATCPSSEPSETGHSRSFEQLLAQKLPLWLPPPTKKKEKPNCFKLM